MIKESIRQNTVQRRLQEKFVARGLASRDQARETGRYVSADAVVEQLEKMLAATKDGKLENDCY